MKRMHTKRWLGVIAVMLVLLAAACSSKEPASSSGGGNLPKGDLSFKVGHPSEVSLYDVVTNITSDRLNQQGWKIENVEFARTDLNSQAVAQNRVQIAVSQFLDPLRAIQKGGKVRYLMENNGGEFVVIARNDIQTCQDIDGKRFGIHGETATSSIVAKNWLIKQCGINPKVLVIPGGDNRAVALRNNQLDAAMVQMSDWLNLDAEVPGKFHLIPTEGVFDISGAGYWGNTDWLEKNREVADAYLGELLKTFRQIHQDPSIAEAAVRKYVPGTPSQIVAPAIKAYIDTVKAWPQNGGGTDMLDKAIQYFTSDGELQPGLQLSQVVDSAFLNQALTKVGKVDGA
jgi:NitT/TauT family transport system substrate-binding protein